jgi:hypothetical protein
MQMELQEKKEALSDARWDRHRCRQRHHGCQAQRFQDQRHFRAQFGARYEVRGDTEAGEHGFADQAEGKFEDLANAAMMRTTTRSFSFFQDTLAIFDADPEAGEEE